MKALYLDTSALLKVYVAEEFTSECKGIIATYENLFMSQIGITETLINLRKRLSIRENAIASKLFEADIEAFNIINFDGHISEIAVSLSEGTNLATLDAIHLASALKFKEAGIDFLTYDKLQKKSAKTLGFNTP